ncbi:MAG: helix-turn-helix domain-containing protein [Saprospiraceae bacterium]
MYQIQTIKSKIHKVVITNLSNTNLNGAFIATKLGVNRMYIHRKLVELHQSNARDYIRSIRMMEAKRLLKETDIPIKNIALELGYRDSSFFTKNFKFHVGVTPLKYRKSIV